MELKISRRAKRELEMLQRAERVKLACVEHVANLNENPVEQLQKLYVIERRHARRFNSKTYLGEIGRENLARIEGLLRDYGANPNGDYIVTTYRGFSIVKLRDTRYNPPYRVGRDEYVYGYYESVDDAKESIDEFHAKK